MSENSPVKTPPPPPLFPHLYSQYLLSFCIMPPHLSPSPPSFSPSCPSFLTSLPPHTFFSVLLCLSSSCIASPAPWCGTGNQNSAHIRTCTRRLTHVTHAQGDTRPPLPAAPLPPFYTLTPLHCRHETFYNRWCASSSSRDSVNTTSN